MKIFLFAFVALTLSATARPIEIYEGEPFAEALSDMVASGAIAISHRLAHASPLERSDVFKLRDGKLLVVLSVSTEMGEPYTVKKISFIPKGK